MSNEKLLKRLQIGTRNYDEANNLHAECYGAIGALEQEVERLKGAIQEHKTQASQIIYEAWFDTELYKALNHKQGE